MAGYAQDVVGKNKSLVQFKDGDKKDMSYVLLLCVCSKEEVCHEMDEPISDLPPKEQGEMLTVDGEPVVRNLHVCKRYVFLGVLLFV